ncbi:hypothetical protein Purlil1_2580 [Purpureocillium lilacinum]|uniref:Uncharacterized protein n=1 Tax=Purpureocillium lilacinum TaxID=33203 RepID=A0ABR0CCJ2_PURLI|nr:hypothetical protein Purlil1_2580 [Purpureocillium lilacinum]
MHDSAHGTTQPEAAAAAAGSDIPSRGLHCRILYCTVPDSGQSAARSVEACGALHCAMQYAMACLRGEASERARRPAPAAPRAGFCLDLAPALTDRPPQPRHSTTTTLIKNSASARERRAGQDGGPPEAWRCGNCSFRRDTGQEFGTKSQKIFLLTALTTAPPPKTDSNGFVRLMITKKKVSRGGCERVPSVRYCCFLAKVLAVVRRDATLFFNLARAHDRGGRFGEAEKGPSRVSHEHTPTTAQRSTHSQPSAASQGMHKPSMARYILCPPWPLPPPHLRQKSSAFRLDCASRGAGVVVVVVVVVEYVGREGGARAVGRPTTDGDGGDAAVAQMYLKKTDRQEKVILAGRRWNVTGTLAPLPRRHQHGLGRQMREILAVVHPSMESVERARMAWIDEREPALHGRLPMAPSLTVLSAGTAWRPGKQGTSFPVHPWIVNVRPSSGTVANGTGSGCNSTTTRTTTTSVACTAAASARAAPARNPPGSSGARQWRRATPPGRPPIPLVERGAPPWPVPPRTPEARNLEAPGTPAPTGPKRPQTVPSRRTAAPDTGSRTLTPPGPTREHSNTVPEGTSMTVAGWLRLLVPPRDCPATPPSTHRLPGTLALSLFPLPTLSLSLSSPILLSEKPRANAPTPFPPDDVTFAPPPRPSSVRHVDTDTRRPVRQHSHSSAAERVPTTTATLAPCPPASRSLALRLAVPIVPPAVPPRLRVAPLSTAAPTTTYTPGRRNRPISRTTVSLHRESSCTTSATTLRLRRLLSHVPAPDAVAN